MLLVLFLGYQQEHDGGRGAHRAHDQSGLVVREGKQQLRGHTANIDAI